MRIGKMPHVGKVKDKLLTIFQLAGQTEHWKTAKVRWVLLHQEGLGLLHPAPGRSCGSPLSSEAGEGVLDSPATWLENLFLREARQ